MKNVIEAAHTHWTFLGHEMVYNKGIRAISVATAIAHGITDIDDLYEACEMDIGKDCILGDFDNGEMEVVQGSGWAALHTYLALHQCFGPDWIILALEAYFEKDAGAEDPFFAANDCFKQAHACYSQFKARDRDAVQRWLKRTQRELLAH